MSKDWRETLFVWDGILSFVEKGEKKSNEDGNDPSTDGEDAASTDKSEEVRWQGTWVGCDHADATKVQTPRRGAFDEFVSSENEFLVHGHVMRSTPAKDKKDGEKNEKIIGGDVTSLCRVDMTAGSGYDLGEGDEKKRHKDDRHEMYFFSPSLRWNGNLRDQVENMVLAVGENEFGNFISVGWLRVGNRVTLARRYVDEGDERAKWDIDDLRKAVFGQIATMAAEGHVKLVIPPWQCDVIHADSSQASSAKRQKVAKE